MNIDDLDLNIFYILFDGRKHTSTSLTRRVFSPKDVYELRALDGKVRYHLEKLTGMGILEVEIVNGKNYYSLQMKTINFGDATVEVETNGKKMRLPLGKVFVLSHDGRHYVLGFNPTS